LILVLPLRSVGAGETGLAVSPVAFSRREICKQFFTVEHRRRNRYSPRMRCVQLARVLKKTGSFYYHCDWHASDYVKVMLDQIFGKHEQSKIQDN
jgi:hypothetical protein